MLRVSTTRGRQHDGRPTRTAPVTDTLRSMRRTKIVATIGPASREPETLLRMVEAGMDVARLNYSHGTLDEHRQTVRGVRDAAGRAGRPVAILLDLPGPKLRIGPLREDIVELKPGERLTFSCGGEETLGDARHMITSWAGRGGAPAHGAPGGGGGGRKKRRPPPFPSRGGRGGCAPLTCEPRAARSKSK